MTIGISKERLDEIISVNERFPAYNKVEMNIIKTIERNCTELNPWLPINENTPKDRRILLYGTNVPSPKCFVGYVDSNWAWKPTHWQELPADPE